MAERLMPRVRDVWNSIPKGRANLT